MSISEANFFQVTVFINQDQDESFEEIDRVAFETFSCDGVSDFSLDEAQVDEILGKDAFCGGDLPEDLAKRIEDRVGHLGGKTYVFFEEEAEERSAQFRQYLDAHEIKYEAQTQVSQDWDAEWRKHYAPIEVTDDLRVVPAWMKDGEREAKREIYIDPGRGFGTGEHETTFLCLKHLSELEAAGLDFKESLDFGCGSGILGIAHLLYGGERCDFVDIDKNALDNCLRNIELNLSGRDLNGSALVLRDRFEATQTYDLVFANILEHVLISEKELLLSTLRSGSRLIVSGILRDQEANILTHYQSLKHVKTHAKGDWLAILFEKQ